MLGMAQKLFLNKGGKLTSTPCSSRIEWQNLLNLVPHISYVDYALAQLLLKNVPNANENHAALICYLSLAARQGHLCIRIEEGTITPSPSHLCSFDGVDDFASMVLLGAQSVPPELFTDMQIFDSSSTAVSRLIPPTPLCLLGNLIYLQRYWRRESDIIHHFNKIRKCLPIIQLNLETAVQGNKVMQDFKSESLVMVGDHSQLVKAPTIISDYGLKDCVNLSPSTAVSRLNPDITERSVNELLSAGKLMPEQAEAIRMALKESLSIICGGPGTGKTYTAGELIKIFWAGMNDSQKQSCEIALAAPTGKAASNLQNSLRRAVGGINGFPDITAKTLHALLGIRSADSNHRTTHLTADLILVDESSMIDVHLMSHLLSAVKPGARLIFLGDRYQLPPVSAGMLFADLMDLPNGCCVELKTCLRAELKTIVKFAETINLGDSDAALAMLAKNELGIGRLSLPDGNIKMTQQAILSSALPWFLECSKGDPHQVIEAFNKFRILSPLRQGPFGVDALNQLFVQRLMQLNLETEEWFVAPILLVTNDNRLGLANGEVGILVRRMPKERSDTTLQEGDYALFACNDDSQNNVRKIPALLLPKYEYAYCLSVHKSQGSEFERVLLLMPEGAERFGREVLYTAVTRARKQLDIWGSDSTLRATISKKAHRLSGITQRL